MRALLVAAALLSAAPAFAADESSDLAAVRAELATLRARVIALESPPPPRSRPGRAAVAASRALVAMRSPLLGAFGAPILGYPGGGSSGGGGSVTSAQMPDPYTPTDGAWNVTGDIVTSDTNQIGIGDLASTATLEAIIGTGPANISGIWLNFGTTNQNRITSSVTDGAAAVGLRFEALNDLTNASALLASFGDNAGATYAQKASLDLNGTFASLGAAAVGGSVNGIEIDYVPTDLLATDTTPVSVTGISLAIDASDVYAIHCEGTVFTALATAGAQLGLDLPASATQVATCQMGSTASAVENLSFTADDGACASLNGLATPGASFVLNSKVTNSTNAGNVVLRLRSETTDDVTVVAGAFCTAKRIVDN